ncbi:MAG: Ig-like domain-containing protein [Euryarchaeota archaeon]|nr:Ig-like domain-containing protein [Euryarchaeota archaeon]
MKKNIKQNKGMKISALVVTILFLTTTQGAAIHSSISDKQISFYSAPIKPFYEIQKLINPLSHPKTLPLDGENNDDFSETGFCIRQTSDGGYIVVGSAQSYGWEMSTSSYVLMIKIDAAGKVQWNKLFPGLGLAMGFSFLETNDSGFIITGMTADNETYSSSLLLLKTDSNGNQLWQKTILIGDNCFGYSLQNTSDGGYIITGASYDDSFYELCILLVKTDTNGNMQWNQTFDVGEQDVGLSVQQTNDGGFILAGHTSSYSSDDTISKSILIKTSSNGTQEWNKTIGIGNETYLYSLALTADNKYIATGYTATYDEYTSPVSTLLIKIDDEGNEEWNKTIGPFYSGGASIQRTADNGFIITGVQYNVDIMALDVDYSSYNLADVFLVKVDEAGNEQWNETYDIDMYDIALFVQQTRDNGYIITGYTLTVTEFFEDALNMDVIVIKTISNGGLQWNKTLRWIPVFPDTEPPHISIIKPVSGMFYRGNEIIRQAKQTIISGRITIEANASDTQSGINRVEFYIDGKFKGNDTNAPYTYTWDRETMRLRFSKHSHIIKIIAYDNAGNKASDQMEALRFF